MFVVVLLVGLGLTIGLLISNAELLQPRRTALLMEREREERWQAQQEAAEQRAFEQQRQAQTLENQRRMGEAFANLVERGGPILLFGAVVSFIMLAASWAWALIADGIAAMRRSRRR